jgi:hypothetical protein
MSFPAMTSILVRGALQNVSILYRNASYIADSIFPLINGLNYQTKITKYDKHPWFALGEDLYRAENTTAKRIDMTVQTQNLDPREIAAAGVVSDELFFASNQPGNLPVQPISDTILMISDKIDRFREKLVAETIYGASDKYGAITWADGASGGTAPSGGTGKWAAADTTNTIIFDIETAKAAILSKTGILPNVLMLDYTTFQKIKANAVALGGVFDRIKYTQTGIMTEQLLASLLGLDEVIIGKAVYTADKETKGNTVTTMKYIWDPNASGHAFLYYRPAAAGLKQVSPGYQYRVAYDGQTWRRMMTYREEWLHHSVYEVAEWVDIAPVSTDVGYLWKQTYTA